MEDKLREQIKEAVGLTNNSGLIAYAEGIDKLYSLTVDVAVKFAHEMVSNWQYVGFQKNRGELFVWKGNEEKSDEIGYKTYEELFTYFITNIYNKE